MLRASDGGVLGERDATGVHGAATDTTESRNRRCGELQPDVLGAATRMAVT